MTTVNDKILDAITGHSVDLTRLEASLRVDVIKQLKILEKDLVKKLKNAGLEANNVPLQRKRMQTLLVQTKKTIKEAYAKIDAKEATNMSSVAGIAETQAVGAINGSIKAKVLSVGMSDQTLGAIASNTLIQGAPSREWWSSQATSLQSGFKNIIRQSMLSGETTSNIVKLVAGTEALRYKDGLMQTARNKAEALVRTSVQVVANEARMRTYNANHDIVKYIEWVSTLDSRTSSTCQGLDGKKWTVPEHKPQAPNRQTFPGPTAHWNCRSTQVPVLKSWEELGSKRKFDEIPASTRSSMDGQVSSKISYEDWLESKGQEFQKEVLGPGKFELWKAKKIGFKDLTNAMGNPLTVAQLKLKYGEIPKPAKPAKPAKVEILNSAGTEGVDDHTRLVREVTGKMPLRRDAVGEDIFNSVNKYTSTAFNIINKHLRGKVVPIIDQPQIKLYVGHIDDFIDARPPTIAPFKVYRSRHKDLGHKVGDIVTDDAYGSTTTRIVDIGFGNVSYNITIPTGAKVGPIAGLSTFAHEAEILLPRGYKLMITKIDKQGGMAKYDAVLVLDDI
jgi:SPP1 gp7 family putative phage head morphogenesis protein